jgi:hypothetical protein
MGRETRYICITGNQKDDKTSLIAKIAHRRFDRKPIGYMLNFNFQILRLNRDRFGPAKKQLFH